MMIEQILEPILSESPAQTKTQNPQLREPIAGLQPRITF
jgi:hypothetical protein